MNHLTLKKNKREEVGVGGICNFIVPELNDFYSGIYFDNKITSWKNQAIKLIIDRKEDYFKCIKKIIQLGINKKYPILTSFNEMFGTWSSNKNLKIYQELEKLGINR